MSVLSLSRVAAASALALAAFTAPLSFAADTTPAYSPPAPATATDKLAPARAQIANQKWAAAIEELKRANDTGSADWNNLMGYSLRKAKTPDYAAAERYYNEALRIDPQHRGALEYSGELYLMLGDLNRAEQRMAALNQACTSACTEQAELKAAIERFKANGNRYVLAS